jgi:small nuclear ribonucleoprotein (snRNP)-like protein
MKLDRLIGKRIILFTKKNYRFQGEVKDFDGKFVEIFDDIKQKSKMIHVDNIVEFEVDDAYVNQRQQNIKEEKTSNIEPKLW